MAVLSPQSITRASSRHPWVTVCAWLVAIVTAVGLSSALLSGALTTDENFTNNPPSKQADVLLRQRLGADQNTELIIVQGPRSNVDDPAFRIYVTNLQRDIVALGPDVVAGAVSYYETGDPSLVSKDRHTTLVGVAMAGSNEVVHKNIPRLQAVLDRHPDPAFKVLPFGRHSISREFDQVAQKDLASGEMIGIGAALIILLLVFGALVAGVVPILMGLVSITIALGAVAIVGQVFSFSFFVENMIAMMGLALGIDYSLFVISRYREERARGRDKLAAIEATGGTASRAVSFSGMTVVLALLGMLVVPMTIFRSLAAGAIFVAIASILASLTLLPALLAILGDRVNALRILRHKGVSAGQTGGFWDRIAHGVMRRPVTAVVMSVGVLLLAAAPYFGIKLGWPGVSTLPPNTNARQAFTIMAADFSGGVQSPAKIVIDAKVATPPVQEAIGRLRSSLAADGSFGPTQVQTDRAGDLAVVSAPLAGDPDSNASSNAIGRLRHTYIPAAFAGTSARVLVGGATASNRDGFSIINHYMPIVFALVLGMSFLLLTIVFRSIVVAFKAILMNLLSVGAAYGLLVLVTQKGVGAGILGFQQVESVAAWLPLFLFSVLFGLSMDYHVFLLTRIREHYDQTGDNTASVAYGLRTTAGIITGAALIMVAVFAGFASGNLVMFQQMGFGLGVAVLMDATIVRTILVPASMKLLGDWNWYLPPWLRWLPQLRVDSSEGVAALEPPLSSPVIDLNEAKRAMGAQQVKKGA
jgi:putative drug exporter of the RND superfamily